MSPLPRRIAALVLSLLIVGSCPAYELFTDASGQYVIKWYQPTVELQIKLPTATTLIDGRSQRSSVMAAAEEWNAVMATTRLVFDPDAPTSGDAVGGNGINEIVISPTVDGDEFPALALAVAVSYTDGNKMTEGDVYFRQENPWDSYDTPFDPRSPDMHRVAVHELGHVLGLLHFEEAASNTPAIMRPHVYYITTVQPDDVRGAQALYGAPGLVPPNDNFAAATPVELTPYDITTFTGSNITATHQPGEPSPDGVATGHSVWWSWTSTADRRIKARTAGSNFDTVLTAYTGDSVEALTLVATNDDEETVEDNPTPNRLRTSRIEFNALAGETYHFAVDGWGDSERLPAGSTGAITFTIEHRPPFTAPIISRHSSDVTVSTGENAYFEVHFSSDPVSEIQWQHRTATALEWQPLPLSESYETTDRYDRATLLVRTRFAMNGDQFRCVLTNSEGTVISDTSTLSLDPIPLPEITVQPTGGTFTDHETLRLGVQTNRDFSLTYQWFRNGIAVPDATSREFWLDDPTQADAGTYHVAVTNAQGSVNSDTVDIAFTSPPLLTLLSPTLTTLDPAAPIHFSVAAVSTGSASYQWYHNHRPLAGATDLTLTRTADQANRAGVYWLRATDSAGTRDSDPFFVHPVAADATAVVTWGNDTYISQIPPGLSQVIAVATGGDVAVALLPNGETRVWGYILAARPLAPTDSPVVDISVNRSGILSLLADGSVRGTSGFSRVPRGLKQIVEISAGRAHAVALGTDGHITQWNSSDSPLATDPNFASGEFVSIAAGNSHTVALRADGTVVSSAYYTTQARYGTAPTSADNVVAIAAGRNHSLALRDDGTVLTWSSHNDSTIDVPAGLTDVVAIAAGDFHSVALHTDGRVTTWGSLQSESPPANLPPAYAIAAGRDITLALVATDPARATRIKNLSVRSRAGSGESTLVMGFVIGGEAPLSVLARGIGPTLREFGIDNAVLDPRLTIYDPTQADIGSNSRWSFDDSRLPLYFASLGAFPLPDYSYDAALLSSLAPGAYTAHLVDDRSGSPGIALIEIYDADESNASQLLNVSARTVVGTGDSILVAGFVMTGDEPKTLLIRAVGPTLNDFGLDPTSTLPNPVLKVLKDTEVVAENDDWASSSELNQAVETLGAFPLQTGGRDAALLIPLEPGSYTVQISGADGGTGIALVEIYAIP
ncbi:matrixin family metalloprotease [Synoicihabitans lomoniglobus]|uniref:Matrixin family metalloprotease n=1 Tax=Synoicihabitans lomoniglobus TaxID=2909285 RepID=A0AAF0A0R7_9BACT|nr:matrixin family metalloprotease [Opitutaceae bacterium LMO-M01]WED65218.1 matrixin family metalloprotease [Opitutaceae bacterium LMO-M01]